MRARGRLDGWDEVQENNKLEFPDPAPPTYEGRDEWQEAPYEVRHVNVPRAHIASLVMSTGHIGSHRRGRLRAPSYLPRKARRGASPVTAGDWTHRR